MLLFNGLYYRGNWATPFLELNNDEFFYMTSEDAVKTPMMHARGKFHVAECPELNAKALCIPYEVRATSALQICINTYIYYDFMTSL